MEIRKTVSGDIDRIMDIYEYARNYMVQTGNQTQWVNGYPRYSLIEQDINEEICFVCIVEGTIEAVFVLVRGEDPTYARIDNGAWKNELPYGTIHRIASSGNIRGIATHCIRWCFEQCPNLRADTHEDNKIMQHLLEKNGFDRCGIIYVEDGSPRIAYQKTL